MSFHDQRKRKRGAANAAIAAAGLGGFMTLACDERGSGAPGDPGAVEGGGSARGASAGSERPHAPAGETSAPPSAAAPVGVEGDAATGCWQLPVVSRARLRGAPGAAAALAGGKIAGSNTSPMNDFVDLASIATPPAEGEWLELRFDNTRPFRYVKYFAPPASHGALAELELYSGDVKLDGEAFGTAGSLDGAGTTFELALDGDVETYFRGPLPNDAYVGLDLAAGHVAAAPSFTPAPGMYAEPPALTLSAEPGASIFYTLDGGDPGGSGVEYTGPIDLPPAGTLVKALAVRRCAMESELATGVYRIGTGVASPGGRIVSSMHVGNSLTDTIVDHLEPLAQSAGILLEFSRYTIPGAGTWLYIESPTGGFGVDDVQLELRSRPFDHLSMQPYPNLPCQIRASADGSDSDSGYIARAWSDARAQNPDVQLWIYQQWPEPDDFTNCFSGGDWLRSDWQPPAPGSWEEAVMNELAYHEALVAELMRLEPDAPRPFIVPGGLGLLFLKRAVEAGQVPGFSDFFAQIFLGDGTDVHLTRPGQFMVTLVFYASMFQRDPSEVANAPSSGLTDEQAAVFARVAWETVTGYAGSGVPR